MKVNNTEGKNKDKGEIPGSGRSRRVYISIFPTSFLAHGVLFFCKFQTNQANVQNIIFYTTTQVIYAQRKPWCKKK